MIEVFGPTIQGEGPAAGQSCHFVRFGGCDYRCSWCDSMYAVEPAEVRANAERLTASQIAGRLRGLASGPQVVVLSGGNPALHELGGLVDELHEREYQVHVETQGSIWRDWLADVDQLVISPKPPSSGETTAKNRDQFERFMGRCAASSLCMGAVALKIVIADRTDLEWAKGIAAAERWLPLYLSVMTPQPTDPDGQGAVLRSVVCQRFAWLAREVAHDPELRHAKVLPQLHVLAWGAARGV